MRTHDSPSAGSTISDTVKVHEGGTGQTNTAQALSALNAIPVSRLNQPNGIAALDNTGKISSALVSLNDLSTVSLSGPITAPANSIVVYQISNFDTFIDYQISALSGVVVRDADQITYFTPSEAGEGGFTINNRSLQITITTPTVVTPVLFAADSGTGPVASIAYTASEFSRPGTGDAHLNSDWQVASDVGFSTIVAQSMADAVNLTARVFGGLALTTTYHARVRYRSSNGGLSAWSAVNTFTTRANVIPDTQTPTLSVVDSGVGSVVTLTYNGSAFSRPETSDTHLNSDWQVASDAGFTTIVVQSMADTVNRTTRTFTDLALNTTYHARVRYRSSGGSVSQWSITQTLTTKSGYTPNIEEVKLVASDRTADDYSGWSVSMNTDGSRVVVGAMADDTGSAYVYVRSGNSWSQEAKLLASDRITGDGFGWSVSMTGDATRVVVGSRLDNGNAGSAYVYVRSGSTWTQETRLFASDLDGGGQFGFSVAISDDGTRIISGAVGARDMVTNTGPFGAVFIYRRTGTTWTEEIKLMAHDRVQGNEFGRSVAINADGTRVVSGARFANIPGVNNAGAVYVYLRTGTSWSLEAKLNATDGQTIDQFGSSVSMSADAVRLVVGATNHRSGGFIDAGAIYVFTRSAVTWTQEAKLSASDRVNFDQLGYCVAMTADGSRVVSGAHQADRGLSDNGAAYIYVRSGSTWTQEARLLASDTASGDRFGSSICISADGTRVAVGSPLSDVSGVSGVGSTYIYRS